MFCLEYHKIYKLQKPVTFLIFMTHCKTWAHTDLLCRCCPTKRNYSVNSPKYSHCMMVIPWTYVVCCLPALVYFGISWQTLGCCCVLQDLPCFHSSSHLAMIGQCPVIHSSCHSANESTIQIAHWSTICLKQSILLQIQHFFLGGGSVIW